MATVTEPKELKAGRELDALVAVKVMGWMRIVEGGVQRWANIVAGHYGGTSPSNLRLVRDWEPSTDIAAAWEVVEKIGGHFHLARFSYMEPMFWRANFTTPEMQCAEADSAPLAICLAALKAVQS